MDRVHNKARAGPGVEYVDREYVPVPVAGGRSRVSAAHETARPVTGSGTAHWSLHAPALPTGAIGDRSVESETEFVDADRLAVYRAGLLC